MDKQQLAYRSIATGLIGILITLMIVCLTSCGSSAEEIAAKEALKHNSYNVGQHRSSSIGKIDLPEEIGAVRQGDTLVLTQHDGQLVIYFYHKAFEEVSDSLLFIVQ